MRVKRIAIAIATALLVLTTGVALAEGHVAGDGQTLADQPPEVRQLYESIYGDDAATQWAADHDAEIGRAATGQEHPRYDEVYRVAYHRSMDMELAARVADDVIARGTIDLFLAGMDPGVLYGYVDPPCDDVEYGERYIAQDGSSLITQPAEVQDEYNNRYGSPHALYRWVWERDCATVSAPTAPPASSAPPSQSSSPSVGSHEYCLANPEDTDNC